jgi:hypothetical protein
MAGSEPRYRGPSGVAPLPPDWLARRSLPIFTSAAGRELYRIHQSRYSAVFFGPGPGKLPTHRFDPASGRFGILYLGDSFDVAFVEAILRNPQLRSVRLSDIHTRSCSRVAPDRELRLAKMFDEGLSALGCDNAIATGPYEPCGLWSDALWDHREKPDGIAYRSRHDPAHLCFAVFERNDITFTPGEPVELLSLIKDVAGILDRYKKALVDDVALL